MFATTELSNGDFDDFDVDSELITCPFCMRSFDPTMKRSESEAESQSTGLDELVDLDADTDDGDNG
jgi:hypothetical protein